MNSKATLILEIPANQLSQYAKRAILGQVWLSLGDFSFPEENWEDFVDALLAGWISTIDGFLKYPDSEPVVLCFFEGPYRIKVSRTKDDRLSLAFIEYETELHQIQLDIGTLVNMLVVAARGMLQSVGQKGWSTPDTKKLQVALNLFGVGQS